MIDLSKAGGNFYDDSRTAQALKHHYAGDSNSDRRDLVDPWLWRGDRPAGIDLPAPDGPDPARAAQYGRRTEPMFQGLKSLRFGSPAGWCR